MTSATHCTDAGRGRRAHVLGWAATLFGLSWVAAPAVAFTTTDPSPWQVALVAAGLPAFAYLFLSVAMTRRAPVVPLVAMTVISVALTLGAESSFSLLFIYTASAGGVRLAGRESVIAVAGVTAVTAATLALTDPEIAVYWGLISAVAGTGTLWLLIGGLMRSNQELREARAELADQAVAEERLRLARDLHDLLGHDLSLIALKADLAGKLLPDRVERARTEVDDIATLTRSALTQVRQAVGGYRRPALASELAGARVALEAAGVELEVEGAGAELDPDAESVLAWAVREGATNVIRHSGARRMEVTVTSGPETTELELADDGPGLAGEPSPGHGLTGLRERAESIGGTVETDRGPHGGFRLRVSVPTRARALVA